MNTRKTVVEAHGSASAHGTAQNLLDLRETLSCVAKLASLIVSVSDGKSDRELYGVNEHSDNGLSALSSHILRLTSGSASLQAIDTMSTTPLAALEATFDELRNTILDVKEKSLAILANVLEADELEDKLEEIVQPIEDRILKVAWQISELSCQTPTDMRIKAKILKFLASDEPDDIESALTQSLCDDILSLSSDQSD